MVVIAADTNVWARAYLNDDLVQTRKSRSALVAARSAGGVFIPLLVLAELSWVLRGRWDRERVLSTIEKPAQNVGCGRRVAGLGVESFGSLPQRRGWVRRSPHSRGCLRVWSQ